MKRLSVFLGLAVIIALSAPVYAGSFYFSTGNPDDLMGMASRPDTAGKVEIESADDFIVTAPHTHINQLSFTGLLAGINPTIDQVRVEIYRIFPKDSDTSRAINVPTRINSPSDVVFAARDSAASEFSFQVTNLGSFTAANSVLDGIHPTPNQATGGEGPVTGTQTLFNITLNTPFELTPDHYFFVPQVAVSDGEFYWLSAPKPISAPGTLFSPDLQTWIRNGNLSPDWLRVGTDITQSGPFNAAFSLSGNTTPEPSSLLVLAFGGLPVLWKKYGQRQKV